MQNSHLLRISMALSVKLLNITLSRVRTWCFPMNHPTCMSNCLQGVRKEGFYLTEGDLGLTVHLWFGSRNHCAVHGEQEERCLLPFPRFVLRVNPIPSIHLQCVCAAFSDKFSQLSVKKSVCMWWASIACRVNSTKVRSEPQLAEKTKVGFKIRDFLTQTSRAPYLNLSSETWQRSGD